MAEETLEAKSRRLLRLGLVRLDRLLSMAAPVEVVQLEVALLARRAAVLLPAHWAKLAVDIEMSTSKNRLGFCGAWDCSKSLGAEVSTELPYPLLCPDCLSATEADFASFGAEDN